MKRFFLFLMCLTAIFFAQAQTAVERPKLVVGIVVDQMRYEYLYRYYSKYGEGGFKKLMNEGFVNHNTHYNYVPTYTGPGHASVYTGTTPAYHGIIANNWYVRTNQMLNCVADSTVNTVGNENEQGKYSPRNLITTTITDELKWSLRGSKVFSASIKNRGAILPAGHIADGAFWYDYSTGDFITSTHYMEKIPGWLRSFNDRNLPEEYLSETWETLLPIKEYTESGPDDSEHEQTLRGMETAEFPYNLTELAAQTSPYQLVTVTPYGNQLVMELSKTIIEKEKMGKDEITDFLSIGISSTDVIGHQFGPQSVENQDTYLRLDIEIESLLKYLDEEVGAGQYLVFLTSDHGVAEIPSEMVANKLPGDYFELKTEYGRLNTYLAQIYGAGRWIMNISNHHVFLDRDLIRDKKLDLAEVQGKVAEYLRDLDGVLQVYTGSEIRNGNYDEGGLRGKLIRGYNHKRSGDVIYLLESGWFDAGYPVATTHGAGYTYDTHVPLLWYGWKIPAGESYNAQVIPDIAVTLAHLLKVKLPSGATGEPILEIMPEK